MQIGIPLNVLLVEDSEDDALLIIEELREGGYEPSFERAYTRQALETVFSRNSWDIIISDYMMPSFTGLDALKLVRELDSDVPFIIVSGQISEDTAVEAMRAGAQDYVLKNNLARLSPAVGRELAERKVRRERRAVEQELQQSQELFAKAFRSGPMIIAITHFETGRCIEVNETFEEMMGYNCDEVVGTTPLDLQVWADSAQRDALLQTLERNERVRNWEVTFRARDGGLVTGLMSADVLEVNGERHLLTLICDISDRKKAEEALERALDEAQRQTQRATALQADLEQALHRERNYSLLLQRALLPARPTVGPGYEVAAEYAPVFVKDEIGGDFYDVFRVNDTRAGVLIGDVSGKGLEAAALAATTRSTIHAFVHETASAAEALSRANVVMYSQNGESQANNNLSSFVTVFLAIIDLQSGEMRYASAGHPPQILSRANGVTELLKIGELPLAIVEDQAFEDHHIDFYPGDKLVLYTDGISEARRDSQLLDIEGILHAVAEHSHLSAQDLAHTLLKEATEFTRGSLTDDAAVVIVERTDPSGSNTDGATYR